MDNQELLLLLQQAYPEVKFQLQGDSCHLQVLAVGEIFNGLSRIKRQQLLNSVLKPLIQEGSVHAVNYKLLTSAEAQATEGITWTN